MTAIDHTCTVCISEASHLKSIDLIHHLPRLLQSLGCQCKLLGSILIFLFAIDL